MYIYIYILLRDFSSFDIMLLHLNGFDTEQSNVILILFNIVQ